MLKNYRSTLLAIHKARQGLKVARQDNNHEVEHCCLNALIHLHGHLVEQVVNKEFNANLTKEMEVKLLKDQTLIWVQWGNDGEAILTQSQYDSLAAGMDECDFATHTAIEVDESMVPMLKDVLSEFYRKNSHLRLKVS